MQENSVITPKSGEINQAFENESHHTFVKETKSLRSVGSGPDSPDSIDKMEAGKSVSTSSKDSDKSSSDSEDYLEKKSSFLRKHSSLDLIYKYRGIICALLTAILLSLATFLVSILVERKYSPFLTTFWRFIGILVPSIPMVIYYRFHKKVMVFDCLYPITNGDRGKNVVFLAIRCIVGSSSFVFQYTALRTMQLADVSVITFSSTVFVVFFAWCCLGEECGIVPTILAVLTVLGVVIIAQPPLIFGKEEMGTHVEGLMFALGAMFANTFSYILLRFLREIHYTVMAMAFGTVGTLVGLVLCLGFEEFKAPMNLQDTMLFLAMAILSCLGQITLTLALKYEEAGPVSVIRATDACFSFGWQAFNNVVPSAFSLSGGALVISCVFLTGYRKWLSLLKPAHPCKRKLWFLLK